jgi:hypothetical protein
MHLVGYLHENVLLRLVTFHSHLEQNLAIFNVDFITNPLNAQLNPICRLLALLGAHHIFHVSGLRVKKICFVIATAVKHFSSLLSYIKFVHHHHHCHRHRRHQLHLDRPVSASSNSPFKGLPSRLRPFGL